MPLITLKQRGELYLHEGMWKVQWCQEAIDAAGIFVERRRLSVPRPAPMESVRKRRSGSRYGTFFSKCPRQKVHRIQGRRLPSSWSAFLCRNTSRRKPHPAKLTSRRFLQLSPTWLWTHPASLHPVRAVPRNRTCASDFPCPSQFRESGHLAT